MPSFARGNMSIRIVKDDTWDLKTTSVAYGQR